MHKFFLGASKRLPTRKNILHAIENKSGSEALEMVYSTAALCILILAALTILQYALQMSAVSYAGKRVARYIEVSGTADPQDLQVLLYELLPNADEIGASVHLENTNYYNLSDHKIQLRERFTVVVSANYYVTLSSQEGRPPTRLRFPLLARVNGQSEVYWK